MTLAVNRLFSNICSGGELSRREGQQLWAGQLTAGIKAHGEQLSVPWLSADRLRTGDGEASGKKWVSLREL